VSSEKQLKVTIRYGDIEAEFSGSPEVVYQQVISFMEKTIPEYSLARRIALSLDVRDLIEAFSHMLAYNEEQGIFLTRSLSELESVSDAILFAALKRYIEYKLGRSESSSITSAELESALPAKKKTILNNLTRLVQSDLLKRLDRGDYVITPLGIKYLMDKYVNISEG